MKAINLKMWDNYPKNHVERLRGIQQVIDAVEEYGVCDIYFDYTGRTRTIISSNSLAEKLPQYNFDIGDNYKCTVRRKER